MAQIEKLPLTSLDIKAHQLERLKEIFPEAFTEGSQVDWEKLRLREWILFHPGSAIRKISDQIFSDMEQKFEPHISMELRSVAGAVQCLEAGLGIGFISDLSLTERLTALRVAQLTRRRRFFLAYRRKSEKMAPFVEAILQFAASLSRTA